MRYVKVVLGVCSLALICAGCTGGLLGSSEIEPEQRDRVKMPTVDPTNPINPPDPKQPVVRPVTNGEIVAGRVVMRRLSRVEYANSIHDLLGVDVSGAEFLPEDTFGNGFNVIGSNQITSTRHLETYDKLANGFVEEALPRQKFPINIVMQAEVRGVANSPFYDVWPDQPPHTSFLMQYSAPVDFSFELPYEGEYVVTVMAGADHDGAELTTMEIQFEDVMQVFSVEGTRDNPRPYSITGSSFDGPNKATIRIENFFNGSSRRLFIDYVQVQGPSGIGDVMRSDRVMVCQDETDACARQIFSSFGRRAWRRPLTEEELTRLLALYGIAKNDPEEPEPFIEGIRLGLRAMLISPHFLYRPELERANAQMTHDLDAYELATRLSYFLWSTTPDEALLASAADGTILTDAGLRTQTERMLLDPRASMLMEQFATQWLTLNGIDTVYPDTTLYPDFNEPLRADMRAETYMFVKDFINTDRDMRGLLTSPTTYLNSRLATHYDVQGVSSDTLSSYTFAANMERRGLLGHASFLTSRSRPNRTSPVLRGVWVLEHLLCSAPPLPPDGVDQFQEAPAEEEPKTLRERFEQHASDSSCSGCHQTMDPIGYGLEHYDAIGSWRAQDNGIDVDATGELPGGRAFTGVEELTNILVEDPLFSECLAQQMLTYATGRVYDVRERGSQDADGLDAPLVKALAGSLRAQDYSNKKLIMDVVLSDAFRKRIAEGAP